MEELTTHGPVRSAIAATLAAFLLLAAGCATESEPVPRANRYSEEVRSVEAKQLSSGDHGLRQQRAIAASTAADLSEAAGVEVPDSGSGTYLAAFWGEKRTGGYTVAIESARISEGRATVRLALRKPPPDSFVTQVLTYPYAVAFLPGVDPKSTTFVLTEKDGRKLDWPISREPGLIS